jgi:hypothetical protein
VPDNYHVEYDGFYYSVPYTMHKQRVTLRVSGTGVEIINDNRERVALHMRRYFGSRYVTVREHMPKNHQYQRDRDRFDGARYRAWAANIGENTHAVIETMLSAQHVEETAYRSCMGVLQMSKTYGRQRLEAACQKARAMNSCTYTTIKNILGNAQDKVPLNGPPYGDGQLNHDIHDLMPEPARPKPTPAHENLRGPAAFV